MKCLKPPWIKKGTLGADAARARNRPARPAARCAGRGRNGKTLGPRTIVRKEPALHREAERDTTGVIKPSAPATYADWRVLAREASRRNTPPYLGWTAL